MIPCLQHPYRIIIKRTAGTARREERKRNINMRKSMRLKKRKKKLYLSQTRCDHACLHIIIRVYYWVTTREVDFDECRFALSDPQMFLSYKFALEQWPKTCVCVHQIKLRQATALLRSSFFPPCDELIDIFTYYWTKGGQCLPNFYCMGLVMTSKDEA